MSLKRPDPYPMNDWRWYSGAYRGDGSEDDYVLLGGDRDEYRRLAKEAGVMFDDHELPVYDLRCPACEGRRLRGRRT